MTDQGNDRITAVVLLFDVKSHMNKSCRYCGIVPEDHVCPYRKRKYKYEKDSLKDAFRSSAAWQKMRAYIKRRDRYLCRVCITGDYDTLNELTIDHLEVHHIVPLHEDFDRRLDSDNLITLCDYHHGMADRGIISREYLKSRIPKDR